MRVLIAEDEPDICLTYKIALESRNHEAVIAQDGNESMEIYKKEFLATQHYNRYSYEHRGYEEGIINNKNTANTGVNTVTFSSNSEAPPRQYYSPFDAVVLDYRMPGKDGLHVAKEILDLNPEQRIIFASAYVKETLEDSVKELKTVVELMQKPFDADILVDTIEDKESKEGVKILMRNLTYMNRKTENDDGDNSGQSDQIEPSLEQLKDLFEGLRKIQKGRTF
jgi:DNA-binding NtrC family response regulator